jgi:hypothetical protein
MDTGKLRNNTKFYDGYEGEGEITLSLSNDENVSLHIWDGYFEDIFGNPNVSENGWTGFTKDYQESVRTFAGEETIPSTLIEEYLIDLKCYEKDHFSYDESSECLALMIDLFKYAHSHSADIIVNIQ